MSDNNYIDYDIEKLVIMVQMMEHELRLIKKRSYFRNYYRKHRAKIKAKIEKKKKQLNRQNGDEREGDYILNFD